MQNIIAVIWDFDKTLVDGYMQDPIFNEYEINAHDFWVEVNALPEKYQKEEGVKVNKDTIYLNQFIRYTKEGKFKGLNNKGEGVDVNAKVSYDQRRVDFRNMIYIADGPSDVPAFSVVKSKGGATFAVYPKENETAFKQVEKLREDGRIDIFAEADYSNGTTASMWICNKIKEFAERIKQEEKNKRSNINSSPKHLV